MNKFLSNSRKIRKNFKLIYRSDFVGLELEEFIRLLRRYHSYHVSNVHDVFLKQCLPNWSRIFILVDKSFCIIDILQPFESRNNLRMVFDFPIMLYSSVFSSDNPLIAAAELFLSVPIELTSLIVTENFILVCDDSYYFDSFAINDLWFYQLPARIYLGIYVRCSVWFSIPVLDYLRYDITVESDPICLEYANIS
jgi:hypothetical protein